MEYLVVLGPQGAPSRPTLELLHRSSGKLGAWLISEAFEAYRTEVQCARRQRESNIASLPLPRTLDDFLVLDNEHQGHQAIKSFLHCLVQALCIFSTLDRQRIPVQHLIGSGTDHRLHVVGFCTGALTAQAFATSTRLSQLVFRLVEALRLAFWIGLRVTQTAFSMTEELTTVPNESWCAAASHCSIDDMQQLLHSFSEAASPTQPDAPWITVVSTPTRLSIGGRPASLDAFRSFVAAKNQAGETRVQLHPIQLNAPYHSQQVMGEAARRVRDDVAARHIQMGTVTHGRPILDNITGTPLPVGHDLADSFIESILLQTSRWDLMTAHLVSVLAASKVGDGVCIVNGGPDHWHASDVHQRIQRAGIKADLLKLQLPAPSASVPSSTLQPESDNDSSSSESGPEAAEPKNLPVFPPTRVQRQPIAITVAFFGEVEDASQAATEQVMDQAANHLNALAPSCYFEDDSYASKLGCFFNQHEEPVQGGQGLALLRRLITRHSWPDPALLGHENRPGLISTLHRAASTLKQGLCKVALAGGFEHRFGQRSRVVYVLLELLRDAQQAGTRPLAVLLNSTGNRRATPARSHEQTMRKLLDCAGLDPQAVSIYSGAGGEVQVVQKPDRLFADAVQRNLSEAAALEKLLAHFAQNSHQTVIQRGDGVVQADQARCSLLYTVDSARYAAALVCQEPPVSSSSLSSSTTSRLHFVGLSADTHDDLMERVENLRRILADSATPGLEVGDVAFAASTRPTHGSLRIGITATSTEGLGRALETAAANVHSIAQHRRAIAFVFPGQGCQYKDMGRDLYMECAPFRERMQRCERLCRAQGFPSFLSTIYADLVPSSASTPTAEMHSLGQKQQEKSAKDQADQLAIFSLEVSLAETLIAWGVQPVCVAGHSLGHYAACYLAGVLSLSDALFLVARRASLFAQLCMPQTSQMMAMAGCTEDQVQDHISQARSSATIACYNGPTDHVLSGTRDDLAELHKYVRAKGVKAKLLEVPFGFHSAQIAPVADSLLRAAQCVAVAPPKLAITSSVLGRLVLPGEEGVFDAQYFANHTLHPVRFRAAIDAANEAGLQIADWVEVGPNPICSPMLRGNPTANEMTKLATLKRGADSWSGLISLLGTLWTSGCPVGWKACLLSSGQSYQGCNGLSLSSNPMSRAGSGTATRRSSMFEPFFVGPNGGFSISNSHSHDMFDRVSAKLSISALSPTRGPWLEREDGPHDKQDEEEYAEARTFSTPLALFDAMVRGHRVVGLPVFSASLYGELALEASCAVRKLPCQAASTRRRAVRISNLVFRAPLVLAEDETTVGAARVCIQLDRDGQHFGVSEQAKGSVRLLMTGDVHIDDGSSGSGSESSDLDNDADAQRALRRLSEMQRERRNDEAGYSTLASAMAYGLFAKRVDYCADFRALQSITLAPPSGESKCAEAFGIVRIPPTASPLGDQMQGTVLHPVVHDAMLHSGGFVANESAHLVGASESFVSSGVEEVAFCDVAAIKPDTSYRIHVRVAAHGTREIVAQTHLFDEDGQRVLAWARGVHFRKVQTDELRESLASAQSSPDAAKWSVPKQPPSQLLRAEEQQDKDSHHRKLPVESLTCDVLPHDDGDSYMHTLLASLGGDLSSDEDKEEEEEEEGELLLRLFPGLRGCDLDVAPSGTASGSTPSSSSLVSPPASSSLVSSPPSSSLASPPSSSSLASPPSSSSLVSPPSSTSLVSPPSSSSRGSSPLSTTLGSSPEQQSHGYFDSSSTSVDSVSLPPASKRPPAAEAEAEAEADRVY